MSRRAAVTHLLPLLSLGLLLPITQVSASGSYTCYCPSGCGAGGIGGNSGTAFTDLSKRAVNVFFTPHGGTGWNCEENYSLDDVQRSYSGAFFSAYLPPESSLPAEPAEGASEVASCGEVEKESFRNILTGTAGASADEGGCYRFGEYKAYGITASCMGKFFKDSESDSYYWWQWPVSNIDTNTSATGVLLGSAGTGVLAENDSGKVTDINEFDKVCSDLIADVMVRAYDSWAAKAASLPLEKRTPGLEIIKKEKSFYPDHPELKGVLK